MLLTRTARGRDARISGAAVVAPPINEILQLSLRSRPAATDPSIALDPREKTVKGRLIGLVASEPGTGVADSNALERCANVATSAPFFMCGRDLLRRAAAEKQRHVERDWRDRGLGLHSTEVDDSVPQMNHAKMRRLGWAFVGVGVAAVAYHLAPVSKRAVRTKLRQVDYTAIALASVAASDAFGDSVGMRPAPALVKDVSAIAAVKFPLAVSAAHCLASEVAFFRGSRGCVDRTKRLNKMSAVGRRDGMFAKHVGCAAAAGFFFAAEELWPDFPLLHAAWHCFGAAAMHTGTLCVFGEYKPAPPGYAKARY